MRWVTWVLRVALLLMGVAVLLWLPLSYYFDARLHLDWPTRWSIASTHGSVAFGTYVQHQAPPGVTIQLPALTKMGSFTRTRDNVVQNRRPRDAILPRVQSSPGWFDPFLRIYFPLWLLALVCLAWPVTSLLLARRRRKGRGFAVEPAPDAAPPAIDPPANHPSNLPPP